MSTMGIRSSSDTSRVGSNGVSAPRVVGAHTASVSKAQRLKRNIRVNLLARENTTRLRYVGRR